MGGLGKKGKGIKQKNPTKLIDIDNSMVITREKVGWGRAKKVKRGQRGNK